MARDRIPIVVLGNDGRPLAGATVTVRNHPAGTTATVYSDDSSGATLANPLASDARGGVAGWVDRGMYAATITAAGFGPIVEYFAATPAGNGAIDLSWLGAAPAPFEVGHSFGLMGEIRVPAGNVDVIPRFFVPVLPAGHTVKLKRVRYGLDAGTSATFKLQRNGVDIGGLTALVAQSSGINEAAPSGGPVVLANNDQLRPVPTAVVAAPLNLTLTFVLEHTIGLVAA